MTSLRLTSLLVLTAAAAFTTAPRAEAQLYAADPFNYSAGSALQGQNGGTGFSDAYAARFGNADASVGTGMLTFGSLPTSGNSASLFPTGFGELRRTLSPFAQPDGTTVYASFLLQPNDAGKLSGIELGSNGGDTSTLFVGATSGQYRLETLFGSGGGASVGTGIAPVSGLTVFLVIRIDLLQGNDRVSLFVNPTPGGTEPTTANAVKTDTDFFANINLFGVIGDNPSLVDEFRLGATYADVTPTVPEPSASVMTLAAVTLLAAIVYRHRQQPSC